MISNSDSDGIIPYGFLTPAVVYAGSKAVQTVLGLQSDSLLDLMRSNIVDASPIKNYVGTPDLQFNRVAETEDILGATGISVTPSPISLAQVR